MNLSKAERPLLMGILNVTPDSFSNAGEHYAQEAAVKHAISMAQEGADIIDIGGESTRPGAKRTGVAEQKKRVIPVIQQIRQQLPAIVISIDTTWSEVAAAALAAGANIINDVSAGRDDAQMFNLAAQRDVPIILMHMQGEPNTMQADPRYDDVVREIRTFLIGQAHMAEQAGIRREQICIDPGIGFGKTKQHNLEIIANLKRFADTGYHVLLGASRKRFMKTICNVENYNELIGGTCATTVFAVQAGVKIIRVHDIKENRQALDVAYALEQTVKGAG